MSSQSRNQEFKYQYKTVANANGFFCGAGPTLSVGVPDNLLDIKAMFMHAVFKFDSSVSVPRRKIQFAGGRYIRQFKLDGSSTVTTDNMVEVNVEADPITRVADLKLDITHLKDEIIADMNGDSQSFEQPRLALGIATDIESIGDVTGEIILWKIDFAYTTTGIQ